MTEKTTEYEKPSLDQALAMIFTMATRMHCLENHLGIGDFPARKLKGVVLVKKPTKYKADEFLPHDERVVRVSFNEGYIMHDEAARCLVAGETRHWVTQEGYPFPVPVEVWYDPC